MPYHLQTVPDAPIVIYSRDSADEPMHDLLNVIADIRRTLDAQTEPVYMIYDIRGMSLEIHDMLTAARISARGTNALLHHRHIRQNVYVTDNPLMKMGINGLATGTFGFVRLTHFDTLEDALVYCREKIEQSRGEFPDGPPARIG